MKKKETRDKTGAHVGWKRQQRYESRIEQEESYGIVSVGCGEAIEKRSSLAVRPIRANNWSGLYTSFNAGGGGSSRI